MNSDDVNKSDMGSDHLSEAELEQLLTGNATVPAAPAVDEFFSEMRSTFAAQPTPAPNGALSEFLGVVAPAPMPPPTHMDDVISIDVWAPHATSRRPRVLTSLTAMAGTAIGKIAFGTAVAAASVAGAHTAGVVDVPGLPDGRSEIVVAAADDSSSSSSSTSSSTSTSTTSTTAVTTPANTSEAGTSNSSSSTSSSSTAAPSAFSGAFTFVEPGLGSVSVEAANGAVIVTGMSADAPFTAALHDSSAGEVEVRFTDGTTTIDVEIEIEDGGWKVRVRDRATDSREFFFFDKDGNPIAARSDDSSRSDDSDESDDSDDDDFDDDDSDDVDDDSDDDHSKSGKDSDDDDLDDDDDDDDSNSGKDSDDDDLDDDDDDDHSNSGKGSDDD